MSAIKGADALRTDEPKSEQAREQRKTREKRGKGLILCLAFVPLFLCSSVFGAGRDFQKSLVKVYLNREFVGLLHENGLIPQTRVREVAEFKGAVFDSSGYIVSYVGSYGPDFRAPGAQVTIQSADKQPHPARLIGLDERIALVVLESQSVPHSPLHFTASLSDQQRPLFVLSSGQGKWKIYSPSLFHRKPSVRLPEKEVQVSSLAQHEDRRAWEGGFMMDQEGKLLGIVTRANLHPLSKKIQVCRVLPSQIIRSSIDRILKEEKNISAGWLGILLDVDPQPTPPSVGAAFHPRIKQVISGSPAEKAGLKPGDQLLKIEGRPIGSLAEVIKTIQWKGANEKLTLSIRRQGRVKKVFAVLTERQDRHPMISWTLEIPRFWEENRPSPKRLRMYRTVLPASLNFGFELESLTPQLADYFRTPNPRGLLVKSVRQGSMAQTAGFLAGDVLTQINGEDISSPSNLHQLLRFFESGVVVIQFVRGRQLQTQELILH